MERVVVFRTGQIGDTVVALPALWVVREAFPEATVSLVYDEWPDRGLPSARDVLEGSGLIDRWIPYRPGSGGPSASEAVRLWRALRRRGPETLVYLAPGERARWRVLRDVWFFRLAGVRTVLGHRGTRHELRTLQERGGPFPRVAPEADHLLERLAQAGLPTPAPGEGRMDLGLSETEVRAAHQWLDGHASEPLRGNRPLLAFGPGSKTQEKLWGEKRLEAVGRRLVGERSVIPVVVGGAEDRETGRRLVAAWGEGAVAAGETSVRESAALLSLCDLYVGNDSGPMHLAAAVGTPCVAVFAGRDFPGKWEPYGYGHVVLRSDAVCVGCNRNRCQHESACLASISPDQVVEASAEALDRVDTRSGR